MEEEESVKTAGRKERKKRWRKRERKREGGRGYEHVERGGESKNELEVNEEHGGIVRKNGGEGGSKIRRKRKKRKKSGLGS